MATCDNDAAPELPSTDAVVEEIESSRYGNPILTRGAFGEITIALFSESGGAAAKRKVEATWGYAAVKTIRKALIAPKPCGAGGGGGMGQWGLSEPAAASWGFAAAGGPAAPDRSPPPETELALQLTKEVFCELAALRALSGHPCVARLLASFPAGDALGSGTALSLAFPYCPTDLAEVIARRRRTPDPDMGRFRDDVVRAAIRDVLSAIAHCHSNGVLHRDIKPGNLLVSGEGRIQLTDFGLAKACPSMIRDSSAPKCEGSEIGEETEGDEPQDGAMSRALCTLHYRPPEILFGSNACTYAVDIWGAGLVLAELFNLSALFPGRSVVDQMNRIFDARGTPGTPRRWPGARSLPDFAKVRFDDREPRDWRELVPRSGRCDRLRALLEAMVALDPSRRLTARECLDHAWLSQSPAAATQERVAMEMVPEELQLPPVVLVGNTGSEVEGGSGQNSRQDPLDRAKRRAVEIAATKRAALKRECNKSQRRWGDHSSCSNIGKSIMEFRCQAKDSGLIGAFHSLGWVEL